MSDVTDELDERLDEILDGEDTESTDGDTDERPTAGEAGGPEDGDSLPERSVPSTTADDDTLGHVLASEEIHVGRADHQVNAFVRTDDRSAVRVGDYVQIPYPDGDSELFAVTDRLRYEPYTEFDDKTDTHNRVSSQSQLDEAEYVLVAELSPLAILEHGADGDDSIDQRVVDRVPKPNAPVTLTRDEERLRAGLGIPDDGVFAGWLSVGGEPVAVGDRRVPYYLSNPGVSDDGDAPAVFRHTLVAGSTGKGKTQFTKNLLRQYLDGTRYPVTAHDTGERSRKRLNLVVFDPEDEYAQMADDGEEPDRLGRLRQHGIEHGGVDDLQVFVPQVAQTSPPAFSESRELTIPFEIVHDRPQLLMPFGGSPVTRGGLRDCVSSYFDSFDRDGDGDWTTDDRPVARPRYDDFVDYVDEETDRLRRVHEISKNTMSAVKRRIDRREFDKVFDTGTGLLPEISGRVFREGRVSVIPTSHLRGRVDTLAVLSILSYVIDNKIQDYRVDPAVRDTPILLTVDEAHNYVSSPETIREEYVVERARRTVKQGRKYRLGLCLVTQNPQDVDDDILTQINTNVFLGMKSRVVESVPSVPTEFARDLPTFDRGQAVVQAPDAEPVEVMGLDDCLTRHE